VSGTQPIHIQASKGQRPRNWLLLLSAVTVVSIPAIEGQRLEALPKSVVQVVEQAQPGFAAPVQQYAQATPAQRWLESRIRTIGQDFSGDVGIAVKDLQTGFTTHYDGNSHFPQQSVSKFWVTLTALDKADRGELSLHSPVTVTKSDLTLFNQPIAYLVNKAGGYVTTLSDLMSRAMQQSDNTANDVLLWRAGGPEAVRDFLSRKGISGIRFGPGERVMQSRIAGMEWKSSYMGQAFYAARNAVPAPVRRAAFERYVADPVDGATPLGTVDALAKLKRGELLSPSSTDRLLRIMSNTKTGPRRLKGGLAPGWSLAHKTGTGQVLGAVQSGYNDIGIVTAPDGRSYAVAVLIRKTSAPIPNRMEMMQSVTRAVVEYDRNAQSFIAQRTLRGPSGAGSN
jgi:beta-lactamase class A